MVDPYKYLSGRSGARASQRGLRRALPTGIPEKDLYGRKAKKKRVKPILRPKK